MIAFIINKQTSQYGTTSANAGKQYMVQRI